MGYGIKIGGTQVIKANPVINLRSANWSSGAVLLYWTRPSTSLDGVMIRMSTTGYPADPADGTLIYDGMGSDFQLTNALTVNGFVKSGLTVGLTYYFTAFSYIYHNGRIKYNRNGAQRTSFVPRNNAGSLRFTSSGVWTVPEGVRSITYTLVGAGGGGGGGRYYITSSGNSVHSYGSGANGGEVKHGSLNVIPGQTFGITIGVGGAGGESQVFEGSIPIAKEGSKGGDSVFGTITAVGGNGGVTSSGATPAKGGGSGGGGAGYNGTTGYYGGNGGSNGSGGWRGSSDRTSSDPSQSDNGSGVPSFYHGIYLGAGGGGGRGLRQSTNKPHALGLGGATGGGNGAYSNTDRGSQGVDFYGAGGGGGDSGQNGWRGGHGVLYIDFS